MHSPPETITQLQVNKIDLNQVATPIREAISSFNNTVVQGDSRNNSPLGQTIPFKNNLDIADEIEDSDSPILQQPFKALVDQNFPQDQAVIVPKKVLSQSMKISQENKNLSSSELRSSLISAEQQRDRAIRHCRRQEFFDVLTYSQKCSKLLRVKGPLNIKQMERLRQDYKHDQQMAARAQQVIFDCVLYTSIAYLQLQQFDQAELLSSEIIDSCKSDACNIQFEHQNILLKALLIRGRANETNQKLQQALEDYRHALKIDSNNDIIKSGISSLTERMQIIDCNKKIQKIVQQHSSNSAKARSGPHNIHKRSTSLDEVDSISFLDTQITSSSHRLPKDMRCTGKYIKLSQPIDTLHPASPSFINFDDFEGNSTPDMAASKSSPEKKACDNINDLLLMTTPQAKKRYSNDSKSSPRQIQKHSDNNQTLLQQFVTLFSEVSKFIRANKPLQILIGFFLIVYAYVVYRIMRLVSSLSKMEQKNCVINSNKLFELTKQYAVVFVKHLTSSK